MKVHRSISLDQEVLDALDYLASIDGLNRSREVAKIVRDALKGRVAQQGAELARQPQEDLSSYFEEMERWH